MEIFIIFSFDAAHRLPQVPTTHKCSQLHGHTFQVEIHVSDALDPEKQWVIDFADIKAICAPVIERLDHTYLNDIEGLENPTSEMIASWIWNQIKPKLPILSKVVVQESPHSGAVYTGD
jgi:6-pyruvoyltetrahydropterin/6-carboxytetrahydropterin synthase